MKISDKVFQASSFVILVWHNFNFQELVLCNNVLCKQKEVYANEDASQTV